MATKTTAAATDEVRRRYILGAAVMDLVMALDGRMVRSAPTVFGAPFAGLPMPSDDQLGRISADEFEVLFPADSEVDYGYPGQAEADREAYLLAGRMLLALAGASDFCARTAERFLEQAGAIPERSDDA